MTTSDSQPGPPLEGLPDVFRYLDFRAFLGDYYTARKEGRHGFSYRRFSRRAKLKSPNYLKLVIDGVRNLSAPMAERFGVACRLEGDALAYFIALVAFNQAKSVHERNACYARMAQFKGYRQIHSLDLAQAAYFAHWYMPAIRELAARADFRDDPAWIAATLIPRISAQQAAQALETLLALGLLERGPEGVRQVQALVSTGPETVGLHMGNFHRAMMERAAAAIDLVPAAQRDVSSITVCLSEEGLGRMKRRVQQFRRELLEASELESEPDRVVQINFQLFPLSSGRQD